MMMGSGFRWGTKRYGGSDPVTVSMIRPETQQSRGDQGHEKHISLNIFDLIHTHQERASVRATNSYKTYLFIIYFSFSF